MEIKKIDISNDRTKKYYFEIRDMKNIYIEACLLNLTKYGYIICISSQIGCSQMCKFCAAGLGRFVRNLTALEMEEQVCLIVEDNPQLLTEEFQVTYMGAGEPLANFKNVFESIDRLRLQYVNLCKINISTTYPANIGFELKEFDWKKYYNFLHFQYSLHFTNDIERGKFLYPNLLNISDAIKNLNYIAGELNDVYKINYIPFDNLNDNLQCAEELKNIMETTHNAILKLSQMCEINGREISPSKSFTEFTDYVQHLINGIEIFRSDGTDVNAGCGQFYNESLA